MDIDILSHQSREIHIGRLGEKWDVVVLICCMRVKCVLGFEGKQKAYFHVAAMID